MSIAGAFNWVLVSILLIGTGSVFQSSSAHESYLRSTQEIAQFQSLSCGYLDTGCNDNDPFDTSDYNDPFGTNDYNDPFGTNDYDTCYELNCDDDPFGTNDYDNCYALSCDDDPFGTNDYDDCYELSCDNDPFGPDAYDDCYGNQCETDQFWWQDDIDCIRSLCDDDPWNGSTAGCSFGICDDDSVLVDCSYVTANAMGSAEGACDGPLGQTRFDGCYPVSGARAMFGTDKQTFRCSDGPGYLSGGYTLTDVAPSSNDDVVMVLCSGGVGGAVAPDSCDDPPYGIKYFTCEQDRREIGPVGSDGDWYICER